MPDERRSDARQAVDPGADTETTDGRDGATPRTTLAAGEAPAAIERLGKFTLGRKLGAGGMGVVYEAHDEVLNRRVALKLLRLDMSTDAPRAVRLLREARAAAAITHPNVVSVYEVGAGDGAPYIAMELVDGQSLRAWLGETPRPWRQVVAVFAQAGEGLAAAHQAGLIHCDVKPDNILVGADRVRVADFGIARAASLDVAGAAGAVGVTSTIAGTPRYMAPEQRSGAAMDARADQYSFCLTFHEALFGALPAEPPADRSDAAAPVPHWLRQLVARGSSTDASARFASMRDLLVALERGRRRRRRLVISLAAVALAGGLSAAFWAVARAPTAGPPLCKGARDRLAGVWDAGVRDRVRTAALRDGPPYAAAAFTRFAAFVDDYAVQWTRAQTEACEATHLRGVQSEALLDLRMACLDQRRDALSAVTTIAAEHGDPKLLDRVSDGAALPPVDDCADTAALTAVIPPPADPATRARVVELRRRLARVEALDAAGRTDEALPDAQAIERESVEVAYAAMAAEAHLMVGRLLEKRGDGPGAEAALRAAALAAAEARNDYVLARSHIELLYAIGYLERRTAEVRGLAATVEALVARAGKRTDLRADLACNLGAVSIRALELTDAKAQYERCIALWTEVDPRDRHIPGALANLAGVEFLAGHPEAAVPLYQRAVALEEERLGPDHPNVALTRATLGSALQAVGRREEGQRELARALAINERAFGPSSAEVAATLLTTADAQLAGGPAQEVAAAERALAILTGLHGEVHVRVARALSSRASAAARAGQHDDACRDFRRALAIEEQIFPPTEPQLAVNLIYVGECEIGPDRARAIVLLERAVALSTGPGGYPFTVGPARFGLAQALWLDGQRRRARAVATEARDDFAAGGDPDRAAEVEAWLAGHRMNER